MSRMLMSRHGWSLVLTAVLATGCQNADIPVEPRAVAPLHRLDAAQPFKDRDENDDDGHGLTQWGPPVNLGAAINSDASEAQLGISPDGKTLFVTSTRPGGFGDADIYFSKRLHNGGWSPLVNIGPVVNSAALEASPTLSLDGHYLYFASRRAGGFGGLDCWRSYRSHIDDEFGWGPPENLGPSINTALDEADCLPVGNQKANGEFWFTSLNRPDGQGGYDIYRSEIGPDGSFGPPSPVTELNTPGRDTRLTISGNGLTIYFTSNRAGGLGGIDIWTASRQTPHRQFSTPVNLGAIVNSSVDDRSPSITTNGKELYFTSTRPGGLGSDDVYMSERIGGPSHDNCGHVGCR